MARKAVLFLSKEYRDRQGIADFLHQLADKVAEGQMTIRQGAKESELTLPEQAMFKVQATRKPGRRRTRRRLLVEIAWLEGEETGAAVSLE